MKQKWIKKTMLLLIATLFSSIGTIAQVKTITGLVTDKSDGLALPGVTIQVKDATLGTITDYDGNYSIKVSENQILVFSFVGYNSQEIPASSDVINVQLTTNTEALDELIVIGYGVQRKEDKTGAVAQVKAEDFIGGGLTDPMQAIQGKTAGVMITKKGGDPNSGFAVKIRGASGFDAGTDPLYVVDGMIGADPTTVAPEDIESFNILKDAASTAIYGSQGANGVVIITTKKGEKGDGKVQLNMKFSGEQVANKLDLLSASELRQFASDYGYTDFIDGGSDVDWQDQIYRNGFSQNYNVSYSGGSDNGSHYASITRSDWEGVMKGTAKERTIAKLNVVQKALNQRLTLTGTLQGTFEANDYENYDGFDKDDVLYQAFSHNPTDPVYGSNNDYYQTIRAFNYENPLSIVDGINNVRDAKRFLGNMRADMEIIKGLTATVNTGYIRDDHVSSVFRPLGIYAAADNGFGKKEYNTTDKKLLEVFGTYVKTFDESHNLNVVGGYSWQETYSEGFYAQAENPQSDFLTYNNLGSFIDITSSSISSWANSSRLIGFFGRVNYNYQSKYYVGASLRRDGSSKFGINNQWAMFPTASAGWNMHEEDFMDNLDWISQMKVRASWGQSGNQNIGEYRSQVVFESTGTAIDPESGEQVTTFGPAHNANPNLKWETTTEFNVGLDFGFLSNRINGSLEVFMKNTTDLLGEYSVPVPPNLAQRTYFNTGSLSNNGIELFLQGTVVDNRNFKWKSSFTATHIKTKVNSLGDNVEGEIRKEGFLSGRGLIGDFNYVTGNIEGEELGAFYLPVYVTLSDDGVFLYQSVTGGITRNLEDTKRELVGSPLPDYEFGWSNNFTFFKNISLDISIRSMIGNDVYNATRMFFDYPGLLPSLNATPDAVDWKEKGRTSGPSIADIYVEDGSFLKVDYVSLGYNVPLKNKEWLKALKVFASANNLLTLTKYTGIDPETSFDGLSFGVDQFDVYPKSRTITFGVNATF